MKVSVLIANYNDKLMKKINFKNRLIDLEKDCKAISRVFFKKK